MTDGRVNYRTDVTVIGTREFTTRVGSVDLGEATRVTRIEDDRLYGQVLDATVPTCVDTIIYQQIAPYAFNVLLGHRQQEPQPDWWVIGGRMQTGEAYWQAAARNVRRELLLMIDSTQLSEEPIGVYSLNWDTRAQKPVENGCHMTSILMAYAAQMGEIDLAVFNREYSELKWAPLAEITGPDSVYHPALRRMGRDLSKHLYR